MTSRKLTSPAVKNHFPKGRALSRISFALISLLAVMLVAIPVARAAKAEHLGILRIGNDEFFNYDFSTEEVSKTNVDFAFDMFFYNDSSVSKVKSDLHHWLPSSGDPAYAIFAAPGAFEWGSDKGGKSDICTAFGADNLHYRIYGPPSTGRFYSMRWGFFNIATTHIDHNECGVFVEKWSGESEVAEEDLAAYCQLAFGRRHVKEDAINFHNAEKHYVEGSHHWEGNGLATMVWVR